MSESPAKALARCKVQHPTWRIVAVDGPDWSGYVATRGPAGTRQEEVVTAPTVLQLEAEMAGR